MPEEEKKHEEHAHAEHLEHAEHEEHVHHEHNEKHHKEEHVEHKHEETEPEKEEPADAKEPEKSEKGEKEKEPEKPVERPQGEKKDLLDMRISVIVFAAAGVAMGLLSSFLKPIVPSNWIIAIVGLMLDFIMLEALSKLMKRKAKFHLAGFFIYFFIWLVSWIFLSQTGV